MMRGLVVVFLLKTITVVQGQCNFPSELVGRSYDTQGISDIFTFSETQMIAQGEAMDGSLVTILAFDCLDRNGDFYLIERGSSFDCLKFISTDSSTPQAYVIGQITPNTGNPTLCDVCANMFSDPFPFLFREYQSLEPFPSPLPVGCDIPSGCPLTTSGTPCTSTPSTTLEGFCSELLGILEECSETSESSSSSRSSEEGGGGGGRRALRRHINGKKQKGKKQKGKKQKGKSNSKEKCNKYEELKAFIKDTCENVALTL